MGTISDKLTYLNDTKTAIKEAIAAKGIDVADSDTFRSYAEKIGNIKAGGGSSSTFTTDDTDIIGMTTDNTDSGILVSDDTDIIGMTTDSGEVYTSDYWYLRTVDYIEFIYYGRYQLINIKNTDRGYYVKASLSSSDISSSTYAAMISDSGLGMGHTGAKVTTYCGSAATTSDEEVLTADTVFEFQWRYGSGLTAELNGDYLEPWGSSAFQTEAVPEAADTTYAALGCYPGSGTVISSGCSSYFTGKIYSVKIRDGSEVHEFVPCVDLRSGTPVFVDKYDNTIYTPYETDYVSYGNTTGAYEAES